MLQFKQYSNFRDWDDDVVLLYVQDSQNARVVTQYPARDSGPMPMADALEEVARITLQDIYTKRAGAYLDGGAVWDPIWGELT